ncbi:putative pectin lyase a precursor protein [Lasiodiplodia theobromae]|uniref:pectin lyase n=2 Tax=Lasiodiplodia TaxID=66739 RepID=A0A5N5D510_9PEZI|nr:Pectin lyase [Lasiodiplodia theobromae]KAB2572848.1 putative pectin lyase F [Lasiodiplodia theobromae]KAF4537555.1 Pectin lyase [Lasiodiplodia theobromae]KAF9639476.1 putative pectin lyase a precursor protein [Lasiodiplodia theobromae]KAK0650164.1 putative pectin lyase F [Lasiodiplodia hormozganensis]
MVNMGAVCRAAAFFLPALVAAQSGVVGTPSGFATGVTGGGDASPAAPSDVAELISWLEDETPRVILVDKEFNFIGTEGTKSDTGCRPDSNTCPDNGGQDAINEANWCSSDYPSVDVKYDQAAMEGINVKSNKSLVGVGDKGVLKGKGLRLTGGVENIIIQNVHITDLNPQYIWGGDAITLAGSDKVWIDHCKFSLVGRQMIVTGYDKAGKVTISNNEFDGTTDWSASCNGEHYWTVLVYGADDQITFANNYMHDTSGRSPKIGGADGAGITFHAVNNVFQTNKGHNFDIGSGAEVLLEGNVFNDCNQPITAKSASEGGAIFNTPSGSESSCSSYLKRDCVANSLTSSGDFGEYKDTSVLEGFNGATSIWEAVSADEAGSDVVANAGIGKLSGGASNSTAKFRRF